MAKGLTRDTLATHALTIVDADGLGALSMRRLASELGVDPMAAYRHVPNKDALLDAVLEAVLGSVRLDDLGPQPGGGVVRTPQARLMLGVRRVLDALLAHPNAVPLFSARKWLGPSGMTIIEWGMATLAEAGVEAHRAVVAMNATGLFLVGLAQAMTQTDPTDARETFAANPASFPVSLAALQAGEGLSGYDELLDYWLELMSRDLGLGGRGSEAVGGCAT